MSLQTMKNNIEPVIKPLFYETGAKKTVPICPMDCVAWFHPYVSFHSYNPGDKSCKIKATQGLPFFVDNFGPKWTEFTTTAHEQLPGHHLEVSYFQYSQVLGKYPCFIGAGSHPLPPLSVQPALIVVPLPRLVYN